jgi:hypothetical protein
MVDRIELGDAFFKCFGSPDSYHSINTPHFHLLSEPGTVDHLWPKCQGTELVRTLRRITKLKLGSMAENWNFPKTLIESLPYQILIISASVSDKNIMPLH